MTAEEELAALKAKLAEEAGKPRFQQTFIFKGNVGQHIDHVDKIEAHFDKDMGMHIVNAENIGETGNLSVQEKSEDSSNDELSDKNRAVESFIHKIELLGDKLYDEWNGKEIVPAIHQPMVKVVIKRNCIKNELERLRLQDFDALLNICYPITSKTNGATCRFVKKMINKGWFGKLPKKEIAKAFAPILDLTESTTANYLS